MNYRHDFHAGNFADVLKHAALTRALLYLRRKDKPFRVIDTHAGAGLYDLAGPEATRSQEARDGVLRLLEGLAPGPAADHLARRGPGVFQALYRTTSMGAAARWMESHGMPPPARGVRSNGEHAMLATPADTCGAYIGFVGPE